MENFINAQEARQCQISKDRDARKLLKEIQEIIEELLVEDHEDPVHSFTHRLNQSTFIDKQQYPCLITAYLMANGYNVFSQIDDETDQLVMHISW